MGNLKILRCFVYTLSMRVHLVRQDNAMQLNMTKMCLCEWDLSETEGYELNIQ
jgi:hypothetical protein